MNTQEIISLVKDGLFTVFACIGYAILVGFVLPKCILKVQFNENLSTDRGMAKFVFPEGRGVTYEPHPSYRRYVNSYILYSQNGYKYLKCKAAEEVKKLIYEIYMFDNKNRVVDVLRINETFPKSTIGLAIPMHSATSYVKFELLETDSVTFENRKCAYIDAKNVFIFRSLCVILSVLLALLIRSFSLDLLYVLDLLVIVDCPAIIPLSAALILGLMHSRRTVKQFKKHNVEVIKNAS